ncbi:MAG: regulatory iron-sulfur-containing complex subunit RicT [Candidatus Falkowbacteria bacterium]
MKAVQIQFAPWDKIYNFDKGDSVLVDGDFVVVKTEIGTEVGKVIGFKTLDDDEIKKLGEIKPIMRKATSTDLEKVFDDKQKNKALEYCKKVVNKLELPMKLVDVHSSFDGSNLTFAFIADGRVDFRDLVKELTRHFSRSIRLQQIGIRDEAKICGDYGHCGEPLCCKKFLKDLSSITSEMAEVQQIAHRGSERISGICGRLMCCLAYEQCGYKEMAEKLPKIGTKVDVDGKKGVIVGHHVLKQSVDVEFPPENGDKGRNIVEVDLNRNKK